MRESRQQTTSETRHILQQACELMGSIGLQSRVDAGGEGLHSIEERRDGIISLRGTVNDEILDLSFCLAKVTTENRMNVGVLFQHLEKIGHFGINVSFIHNRDTSDAGTAKLYASFGVKLQHFSLPRLSLLSEITKSLNEFAKAIQLQLPRTPRDTELRERYNRAGVSEHLVPVFPLDEDLMQLLPPELPPLLHCLMDYLRAGISFALHSRHQVHEHFLLSCLASAGTSSSGFTIGRTQDVMLPPNSVAQLVAKSPGIVALPFTTVVPTAEHRPALPAVLHALHARGTAVIFCQYRTASGWLQQLREEGHEVQLPVIQVPVIPFDVLQEYVLRTEAAGIGGLSEEQLRSAREHVSEMMHLCGPENREGLLPAVIRRELTLQKSGGRDGALSPNAFIISLEHAFMKDNKELP
ncbi:hypothetical protein KQI65_00495 [bacterium]|nr:hypothetical protein [bacterium]